MDGVWGPPLDDYLKLAGDDADQRALPQRMDPSPDDVLSAVDKFKTTADISVQTLEKVLEIERHSSILEHLHSPGMIPACISAVRKCRQERQAILESSIHAGTRFIVPQPETEPWIDPLVKSIAAHVIMSYDSKLPFLTWKSPSRFAQPQLFSFAGGLTASDTRFLLETFFDERKALLHICLKSKLPGFSKVLVIFWQFALSQSDQLFWERLDALQFRNYIVSPKGDRLLTRTFSKPFYARRANFRSASGSCVDYEDAENLLEAFRRNLDLVHPEDSLTSLLWLSAAVGPDGVKTGRYTPTLIKITRDLTTIMIRKRSGHGSDVEELDVMRLGGAMTRSVG
ncbi:hypothetical protein FRC10_010374 [Ceratobasidium sp. 414]|nr:hypothetical protein FRC10_010374 [Ceratobasidium sp. 414]